MTPVKMELGLGFLPALAGQTDSSQVATLLPKLRRPSPGVTAYSCTMEEPSKHYWTFFCRDPAMSIVASKPGSFAGVTVADVGMATASLLISSNVPEPLQRWDSRPNGLVDSFRIVLGGLSFLNATNGTQGHQFARLSLTRLAESLGFASLNKRDKLLSVQVVC